MKFTLGKFTVAELLAINKNLRSQMPLTAQ
jgi:hypothetical protein